MKVSSISILAAAVLTFGIAAPASAAGLLSGVVGTVTDTVSGVTGGGSSGSSGGSTGGLIGIDSGSAGTNSVINVGLGSDSSAPNNIADVNIGGNSGGLLGGNGGLVGATVTGGNGQGGLLNSGGVLGTGLLDGDDDGGVLGSGILGSNLTVGLNLGGLGLDLTVPGLDDLLGGGGGAGNPGNGNGGNGGNGGSGGNGGNGGNGGGRVLVGSLDGSMTVSCSVNDGRKVLQLASQTKMNPASWGRAANVQIVPIKLCPQARSQVAQIFRASGKIQQLQNAAAADALITASLSRTRYDVSDVFAVQASGGRLVVYVY